jgi:hypothetical protein
LAAVLAEWDPRIVPHLEPFDHVFSNRPGIEALRQRGFYRGTRWPVHGFDPRRFQRLPNVERIYDVSVISGLDGHSTIEIQPWLTRMTSLASRLNLRILSDIADNEYPLVLNRSKIVFTRSVSGEMPLSAYEATACGALLFIEEENLEIRDYFVDRIHCVFYNYQNVEGLIAHYLAHPEERNAIANRGWQRIQAETFQKHFKRLVDLLERYSRGRKPRRTITESPWQPVTKEPLVSVGRS